MTLFIVNCYYIGLNFKKMEPGQKNQKKHWNTIVVGGGQAGLAVWQIILKNMPGILAFRLKPAQK
jgi:hypothetical protein